MGGVFAPAVQQLYVAVLDVSCLEGTLHYVLVVGEGDELDTGLGEGFLGYGEAIGV